MIFGIGVDVVDVASFRELLGDPISNFKKHHFTPEEIAYCEGQPGHDPVLHFAGRFAAKEAYVKARAFAWRSGDKPKDVDFLEIEISNQLYAGPELKVSGRLKELLEASPVKNIHLSISHETNVAVAMVVLEG